jgi:hypothetical protein
MSEDLERSFDGVLQEVMDDELEEEYITLEHLASIDTTKFPQEKTQQIWLSDAWDIGRLFAKFRVELNQALLHGEEFIQGNNRYDISRLLSNMLTMEVYLARHGLTPSILTQMKQHRQRLADIYLHIENSSENDKEDDEDKKDSEDNESSTEEESQDQDSSDNSSSDNEPHRRMNVQQIRLEHVYPLEDKCTDWLYIISEKLMSIPTFPVVDDLRVDLISIIENPDQFYRGDVWEWMDEQPRDDFVEACTCLATDNPTASMMLSLRAVEYCLREWYEYDTGRNIENRTWGQVITELEDYYEGLDHRPSVLSNLDYLKTKRNEVSHPDNSPDTKEAERMLYRIEGTISDIYDHVSVS